MKVKITSGTLRHNKKAYGVGDSLDTNDEHANRLVALGVAEIVGKSEAKKAEGSQTGGAQ